MEEYSIFNLFETDIGLKDVLRPRHQIGVASWLFSNSQNGSMKEVITYQPPYSPLLHQMSESALQGHLFWYSTWLYSVKKNVHPICPPLSSIFNKTMLAIGCGEFTVRTFLSSASCTFKIFRHSWCYQYVSETWSMWRNPSDFTVSLVFENVRQGCETEIWKSQKIFKICARI